MLKVKRRTRKEKEGSLLIRFLVYTSVFSLPSPLTEPTQPRPAETSDLSSLQNLPAALPLPFLKQLTLMPLSSITPPRIRVAKFSKYKYRIPR